VRVTWEAQQITSHVGMAWQTQQISRYVGMARQSYGGAVNRHVFE